LFHIFPAGVFELQVGWHLKNPLYPIWLLGSETHLTVLFSEVGCSEY